MLLQIDKVNKRFGDTYALKELSMGIAPGEVHGLVGENGAGKSTLIKILTGVYSMDSGSLIWNGQPVAIESPVKSRNLGINVIHQDRHLVYSFNGIENIYLGLKYEQKGIKVNWSEMRKKVEDLLKEYGIEVNIDVPSAMLTPPERTMLELARAMMTDCKLLILDEPTASLTDKESKTLFSIINRLKEKGTSCLYVSHRMDEIFHLTDRVTILKNGSFVDTLNTADANKDQLIGMMTDNWSSQSITGSHQIGKKVLEVKNLASKDGIVKDASFSVHSGEILGVFGLGGSGRTEMLECIYGYRLMQGGEIIVNGKNIKKPAPNISLKNGLVIICEDRRGMALVPSLSVKQNIVLSTISKYSGLFGITNEAKELDDTKKQIESLQIKTEGPGQPVYQLSGGNQQKVVFAKALQSNPKILLCDEPTQAVDVKTRAEIHKLIRDLADEGNAVVFVSSDLKEVLEIADNIQIYSSGKTLQLLKNKNLTSEDVLSYCYVN